MFTREATRRDSRQYTYIFLIELAIGGADKEHINILPRVAPCRFPCEQALKIMSYFKQTCVKIAGYSLMVVTAYLHEHCIITVLMSIISKVVTFFNITIG